MDSPISFTPFPLARNFNNMNLETFITSYIAALLWSETDDDGESLDQFSSDDIDADSMKEIREDCTSFYTDALPFIATDIHQAGIDFALTRNGHGAGFWDGGWPKDGAKLTELAKVYGTQGLYVGDDGKLYVHG